MSATNQNGMKVDPTMNTLQLIFEIAIIVGYALGILGGLFGLYYLAMFWVIPFAIANMIFALQQKNGTEAFTITNLIMSFVTLIPFIGFFSAVTGIVMSSLALVKVGQYMGQTSSQASSSQSTENITDVQEVARAETKALEAESQTQKKSEPFTQQEPTEQKTEEPKKEEKISQESTEPTKKEDEVAEMKDETKADIVDEKKS